MNKVGLWYLVLWIAGCCWVHSTLADPSADKADPPVKGLILTRAVMCEYIDEFAPQNQAVIFSITVGKISCFTSFDGIKTSTYARHKWFRRDEEVTSKRLTLKPPSWSTYSSIQLREEDKGPWRVEILDNRNQIIKTLRFSVTD